MKSREVNRIEVVEFRDLPGIEGTDLKLGAFSGLTFEGNLSGRYTFKTHTDRGPNLDPVSVGKDGKKLRRPFLYPDFQPRWVQFSFDPASKTLRLDGQTPLTFNGKKMTGLPNKLGGDGADEIPVNQKGNPVKTDLMGIDPEGIARAEDGSYWMSDEYRPSLLHFSADGKLLTRLVPEGSPKGTGTPSLPAHYRMRQLNRGFEGVAYRDGTVYGFLQSALDGDQGFTRVVAVDAKTGKPSAEYRYEFEPTNEGVAKIDKIGDAVALPNGAFLVIEQNSATGASSFHSVFKIEIGEGEKLKKTLVADLVALGVSNYEKVEGLSVVDKSTLALVTDNDFNATGRGENPAFVLVHLAEPLL
jgi:2',3'-cyclic-nucleotide 2'-phosphodiesterase / 3'-nucleotidase / 5'-nucleotidase